MKVRKLCGDADSSASGRSRSALLLLSYYFQLFIHLKVVKKCFYWWFFSLLCFLLPCVSEADEAQGSFTSHLHFELN